MKHHQALAVFALLAAPAAAEEPSVCPVAPSTITFDLGAYRGPYLATFADGTRLGHSGWQSCAPQRQGPEHVWEDCSFSLCDLPDGAYAIHFAEPPAPPAFSFKAKSGQISLQPTPLGAQVAFYGVDATGARQKLPLDLQGYSLAWSIAHWPGPFHGQETHGRALKDGPRVVLSLYPNTPYKFRFGTAFATLSLDTAGRITAAPGGPVSVHGGTASLRVAALQITPPSAGDWSLDGTDFTGQQTVFLPPGAAVTLQQGATTQLLSLGPACLPNLAPGPFKITPDESQARLCEP